MHAAISDKKDELAELCRRYGVARLEVFGSAARGTDFDPQSSDADFLVEFRLDDGRAPLRQYLDFAEALRRTLGRSRRPGRVRRGPEPLSARGHRQVARAGLCVLTPVSCWRTPTGPARISSVSSKAWTARRTLATPGRKRQSSASSRSSARR